MKVFVYYNLHRKMWSIKALEGERKNRVIGHAIGAYLTDVTPKVSEAGRQRVLKEKAKNVHAGLVGNLVAVTDDSELTELHGYFGDFIDTDSQAKEVTYNPYKYNSFVAKDHPEEKMIFAEMVVMIDRTVYCYHLETELQNNS